MELTDEETGVFAPDPVELEVWSKEVERAREEYYVSPGPHHEHVVERRRPAGMVPPWIPTGPARQVLEQTLADLSAARHRVASQRRLITSLQRRIIELEMKTGERDGEGNPLQSVQREGAGDGPEGHGPV